MRLILPHQAGSVPAAPPWALSAAARIRNACLLVNLTPAHAIASIIVSGVGSGRGAAMPTRSIENCAGVSSQLSKPWRTKSLRVPGVVGSQFASRFSPPSQSSKLPSGAVSVPMLVPPLREALRVMVAGALAEQ